MKLSSRMAGIKSVVFMVVVNFLWSVTRGDIEVSCTFMESCILPCTFQASDEVVINWVNASAVNTKENVHSYYSNKDQLANQDQRFKGRTSLLKDQISRGDASLQLTEVEVQDQGRYKCYTSTITGNEESFINLKVDAPVRKINIQQNWVEDRITCSSDGIYPEPELTWSTNSPSNMIQNTTEVQQTEQQLYNISSSLILSDMVTDLFYSCTVSTRRNRRTSAFRQLDYKHDDSSSDTTIPCTASNIPLTGFSLVWRFNHDQIILTQTGADVPYTASEEWRQQVTDVSESGSLTLQDVIDSGMYTCELSNAEETYVTNTFVTFIYVCYGGIPNIAVIAAVVVGPICVFAVVFLVVYGIYRRVRTYRQRSRTETRDPQNSGSSGSISHSLEIKLLGQKMGTKMKEYISRCSEHSGDTVLL